MFALHFSSCCFNVVVVVVDIGAVIYKQRENVCVCVCVWKNGRMEEWRNKRRREREKKMTEREMMTIDICCDLSSLKYGRMAAK